MNTTGEVIVRGERRLCKVNLGASYDELGFFHGWENYSRPFASSPIPGGPPAGEVSGVWGVVEFADGVRMIPPWRIKFCDEVNACLVEMNKHNKEVKENG